MNRFWLVLFVALSALCACNAQSPCSVAQFQTVATNQVIPVWMNRVNGNQSLYDSVSRQFFTDNATLTVDYLGSFGPNITLAIEYGDQLYTQEVTLGFPKIYKIEWLDSFVARVFSDYNLQIDYFGNATGYTAGFFNLTQTTILRFLPTTNCSNVKILEDISIDNLRTRTLNEESARVKTIDLGSICYAIDQFSQCGSGKPYQQFDSFLDCVVYLSQNVPASSVQGLCPQPFSSKTLLCSLLHLSSAFVDPYAHCPHVGKNSAPCTDDCLSDCSACALTSGAYPVNDPTTNAKCVAKFQNFTTRRFECQCLPGTVSRDDLASTPGRKYCLPLTCSNDKQCRSLPGRAACVQGKCVVGNGFVWDSSLAAYNAKNMSYCPHGENQIFWDQSGKPHCVEPGYCLPGFEYNRWQCSVNGLYDYNEVKCVDLSEADYGYGVQVVNSILGPRDWGCVANKGFQGGLGFPLVCPPGKSIVWQGPDRVCV